MATVQAPRNLARSREKWFYWIVTPWLIGFIVFHFMPVAGSALLSFTNWQPPQPPEFIGWAHYQQALSDPSLLKALINTGVFTAVAVPVSIFLGLVTALAVYRRSTSMRLFRAIFLLPAVVPGVATTLIWAWIFNPRYGVVNEMLARVGVQGPAWYFDETWGMPVIILIHLWTAGINMLVYLAAMQQMPSELFEAARLDGANFIQRSLQITVPLLMPITFYLIIVNTFGAFQVFTPIYILTGGGPNNATLTLPIYMYQHAFAWGNLGYAAMIAALMLLLVLGITAPIGWMALRMNRTG